MIYANTNELALGDDVLVMKRAPCEGWEPCFEGTVTGVSETSVRVRPKNTWRKKPRWFLQDGQYQKVEKVKQ